MLLKLFRIGIASLSAVFIITFFYFAKLYTETTPQYKDLGQNITNVDKVTSIETLIGEALFAHSNKAQMRPSDFLARRKVSSEPNETMIAQQIKKLILAKRLNSNYSQEKILSFWLSTAYFGDGHYGLESAAENKYKKDIKSLSKDEALTLAALLKSPGRFREDPIEWEKEKRRLLKNLQE